MQDRYIKKIDFVFFNERKIRQAVFEWREGVIRPEVKGGNKISDPTAVKAIKNLTLLPSASIAGISLQYPETWLVVIDKTYNWCKRQSKLLFESVRKKYLGDNYKRICIDLHISPTTFNNCINRARMYAALQAAQLHLIYVD